MDMQKSRTFESGKAVDAGSAANRDGAVFLTRAKVAKLFGVSSSTITRWARTELIRALRTPGGHYRYRADDVARALQPSAEIRFAE